VSAAAASWTEEMVTALLVRASEITHRTFVLPLLLFYPTSRCNSRCLSCDWWTSAGDDDLSLAEIDELCRSLPGLGTKVVVFSGGEPLLRPDLFVIADSFLARGVRLELLTSGLLLARYAPQVARRFSKVTVSLDAATEDDYREIRGVNGLAAVERGISRLRKLAPALPITARATIHKRNFRELPLLIAKARTVGLDGISFLAADLDSTAFGRQAAPTDRALALDASEIFELRETIEETVRTETEAFESRFVAESPQKLRRLPDYYLALRGEGEFPPVHCNAPWVSAVVEADGSVRPCFFHEAIGNVRSTPLPRILKEDLPRFRRSLGVETNALCQRCVCAIRVGPRSRLLR
jgi:MoaA/NifB/PqqE/SkfB family radical SAM enzyme